ncbi:helix-turn-helix domain-containing protein [Patescibacteria group bacterium]|nr:helix-turn-helix domain-containing protein [Patescibacteria group bacterium]MBU1757969.1 helix-turn-helix domain-containing protein [Patescibacteria group bacterium]
MLQELKNKGRTQKKFSQLIGKKISELNELINGKRNITILRDILLSAAFDNEQGKRIAMQNQHDFAVAKMQVDSKKISEIKRKKHLMKKEDAFERF